MNYGIPYMGSKSKIAKALIAILPKGDRFVDLFGGGAAMSHCALLSGKYKQVYYNDINPLLAHLLQDAIDGKYNYDVFKPEFITREKFVELKDVDGYVKYIWSFGNNGSCYLFGRDIEKQKHLIHDAVVFDDISKRFIELFPNFNGFPNEDIKSRRLFMKTLKEDLQLQQLQQLERLQRLEQLQRLPKIQFNTGSYEDYIYQDGDVVYCDIPYENTAKYDKDGFDHKKFYDWAYSRDYNVFISSYHISDDRFYHIYDEEKRSLLSSTKANVIKEERIYCNKDFNLEKFYRKQLML